MLEKKKNCTELTEGMLSAMRSDNYSHKSVNTHVRYVYHVLTKFCGLYFDGMYSAEAGEAFMVMVCAKELSKEYISLCRNSVDRLNHALSEDLHWRPINHKKKPYASSCFDSIIAEYESYLVRTGKTETNVRHHVHQVARFLAYMESGGVTDIRTLRAENVHEGFRAATDKGGFQKTMKMFFRYAYKYGLIGQDVSCWLPTVSRHKPVPTVYTIAETDKILSSTDRSKCIGKRDYCIILMAARLGMRACDIVRLTFADLNRTSGMIRLTQQKTGVPVEFPILCEISIALEDYIKNAMPDSGLPNVFLSAPRPDASVLSTQGGYAIVSGAITRSGIDAHSRRRGAHALRSSLASQLLDEGNTNPEIQQVLGHTSPDVARHYILVETERLRKCALEVSFFQNEVITAYLERQVTRP